jgi:hypothetical protein
MLTSARYNVTESRVRVTLRLTVGQSGPSWCRAPDGAHDQILVTVWLLRSCPCGAPPLTKGRVCRFNVTELDRTVNNKPSPPVLLWALQSVTDLVSFTTRHWSRSCDFRLQFLTPIVFKPSTESSHLTAGLPTRRVPSWGNNYDNHILYN